MCIRDRTYYAPRSPLHDPAHPLRLRHPPAGPCRPGGHRHRRRAGGRRCPRPHLSLGALPRPRHRTRPARRREGRVTKPDWTAFDAAMANVPPETIMRNIVALLASPDPRTREGLLRALAMRAEAID